MGLPVPAYLFAFAFLQGDSCSAPLPAASFPCPFHIYRLRCSCPRYWQLPAPRLFSGLWPLCYSLNIVGKGCIIALSIGSQIITFLKDAHVKNMGIQV